MQPAIAQDEKFSPDQAHKILDLYLSLSTKGSYPSAEGMKGITHLIWPETAFPFLLDHAPEARRDIASILKDDAHLLTGAVRAENKPDLSGRFYFNAIQMLDQTGTILSSADKVHLVPFGEYLPLGDILDVIGVRDFIAAPGGFTAGQKRLPLNVPHWPLTLPLICYEAIFSSDVAFADQARPGVLLNVTNDAWFGQTAGPWQHFSQARLRTIELGVPMVRAANSGISALLDPYGRDIVRLGLGERGVIDGELPGALQPTFYARLATTSFSILWLFSGLLALLFTLGQIIPRRV
jgi:apolipoprotein N-acyltransferase